MVRVLAFTISGLLFCFCCNNAFAILIEDFPGLDALVAKSDAIAIVRIDRLPENAVSMGYNTHNCWVHRTLKGDIPSNAWIRLRLLNTRVVVGIKTFRFSTYSSHLVFLKKMSHEGERTEYRSLSSTGASIPLSQIGRASDHAGKSVADQIRSLLKTTADYKREQHKREQAFLEKAIE